MKQLLILLALVVLSGLASAQISPQIQGAGAPANPCVDGGQQYVDTTAHVIYNCSVPGQNWVNIGLGNAMGGGVSTSAGVVALFTSCSGTQYLGADGACHNAGGSGTVTNVATTAPLGGGPVSTTGTLTCTTCATTTNGGALSGTAPVAISAAGAISCTTCATTTNGGALTGTAPMAISAGGAISIGLPVNAQSGAGYTVVTGDRGKVVSLSNATAQTVTLVGAPASGFWFDLQNTGVGPWTVSRNGLTIDGAAVNPILCSGQGMTIRSDGSNYFTTRGMGQFGGGCPGDANHGASVVIGSGTSIGSTSLCSTTFCPAGTYRVNAYVDITTACATSGTYVVNLIYTDDQGSKTVPVNLSGTGSVPATGVLTTTSTANFGQDAFVLRSTGAASINYSTTAVACGSAGPMVGNLYLSTERLQ